MKNLIAILVLGISLGLASSAAAELVLFVVPLDGAQEAPGPGDPDGAGAALLTIDSEVLTIDWNITADDIDFPLTGAHIHKAPVGEPGPVVVDFGGELSGAGLADPDLADILANPACYYVNLHNAKFPDGAIRGQLGEPIPEPATISLMAIGLMGLGLSRRRAARRR